MTVHSGPGPQAPRPHDFSYGEAVHEARQDFDRLRHLHAPDWTLDLAGAVEWRCACSPDVPRNSQALDKHILFEVKRARGPIRGPMKR